MIWTERNEENISNLYLWDQNEYFDCDIKQ